MNIGDLPGRIEGSLEAAGTGLNGALAALASAIGSGGGPLLTAAQAIGLMQAAREYGLTRRVFGQRLAGYAFSQEKLVRMAARTNWSPARPNSLTGTWATRTNIRCRAISSTPCCSAFSRVPKWCSP